MTSFLERFKKGEMKPLSACTTGRSRLAQIVQRKGVPSSSELKRILEQEWYDWEQDPHIVELVKVLTEAFRSRGGKQELFPIQAAALQAIGEGEEGAFLAMKMGTGKTHVTYLAPLIVEAKRPVLIVPNSLIDKTHNHFKKLAQHWRSDHLKSYTIMGYSDLGRDEHSKDLENANPDLIVADEGFKLANIPMNGKKGSGVATRVARCMKTRPDCKFVVLGGNLADERPLMQFHHLLRWSLGEKSPMPVSQDEAFMWARALDVKQDLQTRMELGALTCFGDDLATAREGFYKRLYATRGVVYSKDIGVNASLRFTTIDAPNPCAQQIADAYNGTAPNGDTYSEDQCHVLVKCLENGFWYELDPKPPEPWLKANREFRNLCALMLDQQDPEMDTAYQVELFLAKNPYGQEIEAFRNWMAIKDAYKPRRLTRWLSFKVIDHAVETAQPDTILWTLFQAPGELMESRHKLPYFRQGGRDSAGRLIDDVRGGTIVASISACAEGHDGMQEAYNINRVMPPAPGFLLNEQMIARTHRIHQKKDTVYFEYIVNTARARAKLQAYRDQAEQGSRSSRIYLGDWV
jgi:hypothetical protein